jgi:hypothetical protein
VLIVSTRTGSRQCIYSVWQAYLWLLTLFQASLSATLISLWITEPALPTGIVVYSLIIGLPVQLPLPVYLHTATQLVSAMNHKQSKMPE